MTSAVIPTKAGASSFNGPTHETNGPGSRQGDDLSVAARRFEAIFLRQTIAAMRAPSLGDDLFGSDAANEFRDMGDARLADSMAGKFGIATMLERQFRGRNR